jgi:hypothetical protein
VAQGVGPEFKPQYHKKKKEKEKKEYGCRRAQSHWNRFQVSQKYSPMILCIQTHFNFSLNIIQSLVLFRSAMIFLILDMGKLKVGKP